MKVKVRLAKELKGNKKRGLTEEVMKDVYWETEIEVNQKN